MSLNHYEIKTSDLSLQFEFYSEGPKGRIKKLIIFEAVKDNPMVYNLGFGDTDADGDINDTIISNNGDSLRIVATIALAIQKFCERYPDQWVFAMGSTPSRTRLYRMVIANNWENIQNSFYVFGVDGEILEEFTKGREYEAFLIKEKS